MKPRRATSGRELAGSGVTQAISRAMSSPAVVPERPADQAERDGLDQKLQQHVAVTRADRLAQPDLPRPLAAR